MTQTFPQILVVDDCPAIRRLLSKELSASGYMVRVAKDGIEAMNLIHEKCPDYVITDWQMPNMTGEMLCRCIRAENLSQYVYVMIMTAHTKMLDVVDGLGAGADDYISKPVDIREMLARLKSGARIIELDRNLNHIAQHDPLTGTLNRRNLISSLSRELDVCKRRGRPVSCIMADIDRFKAFNDSFGHLVGDYVLMQVAEVLQGQFRSNDYVCRYGGEEFVIILPSSGEDGAYICAERCRREIKRVVAIEEQPTQTITASFGIATSTNSHGTPIELIERADHALRVAKQTGRDRVVKHTQIDSATSDAQTNDTTGNTSDHLCGDTRN